MTQDEIIWQNEVLEMARQAGFGKRYEGRGQLSSAPTTTEKLEAFAKLVEERTAAKEREKAANLMLELDLCGQEMKAANVIRAGRHI
jgi:hypothetical protein